MGWFQDLKKKRRAEDAGTLPSPSSTPEKPIRVSDFLTEKTVAFLPTIASKQQAFGSLINLLKAPNPELALNAIMAREATGTTVIAPGLALPHARIDGLSTILAALGIAPSGLVDPSTEGGPVRLFLLFLGPLQNMHLHLAFLASVSSLFQVEGLSDALLQLTTPEAVMAKIREAERGL